VAGTYADAEAVSCLPWSTRRTVLLALLENRGQAIPLPSLALPTPERGVACVVLCAASVLEADADAIEMIGDEAEPRALRDVMLAVLRSGGGIVDVGAPTQVSHLDENGLPGGRWLVEGSGVLAEVEEFAEHARAASRNGTLACEVRQVPGFGRLKVRLYAETITLDERPFDTDKLPISAGELCRVLRRCSDGLSLQAPKVIEAITERQQPVPKRHAARPTVLQGGKNSGRGSSNRDQARDRPEGATGEVG
jgi:hypothetical protein